MAKKRTYKSIASTVNGKRKVERLPRGTDINSVISAIQFLDLTKRTGGATMGTSDKKIYEAGKSEGFVVGGERNFLGRRIQTKYVPLEEMTIATVLNNSKRISRLRLGNKNSAVGSWVPSGTDAQGNPKDVEIDASAVYSDKDTAMDIAKKRNEKAVFDSKNFDDIENPDYNPNKRQK